MSMIKSIIKKKVKQAILRYHSIKQNRYYKSLLRINGLSNSYVEGEEEWVKKWAVLGMNANPIYYRLFSHYIGNDINIVPEDICHDVIEPILDPFRYTKYYSDKNIFDRLFPNGYLPKTLLRKMKPEATFINTGRGAQVDEAALNRILKTNKNICALLDVTSHEPLFPWSPLFWRKNVFLTPHIAGSLSNEFGRMVEYMVNAYQDVLEGKQNVNEMTLDIIAKQSTH